MFATRMRPIKAFISKLLFCVSVLFLDIFTLCFTPSTILLLLILFQFGIHLTIPSMFTASYHTGELLKLIFQQFMVASLATSRWQNEQRKMMPVMPDANYTYLFCHFRKRALWKTGFFQTLFRRRGNESGCDWPQPPRRFSVWSSLFGKEEPKLRICNKQAEIQF